MDSSWHPCTAWFCCGGIFQVLVRCSCGFPSFTFLLVLLELQECFWRLFLSATLGWWNSSGSLSRHCHGSGRTSWSRRRHLQLDYQHRCVALSRGDSRLFVRGHGSPVRSWTSFIEQFNKHDILPRRTTKLIATVRLVCR